MPNSNIKQNDSGTTSWFDGLGEVARYGRGTTDTDITYIALRNASGTLCYVYPGSGGTTITVTTTAP